MIEDATVGQHQRFAECATRDLLRPPKYAHSFGDGNRLISYWQRELNVSLTLELEEYISSKVQSGNYTPANEVVREGLRLLQAAEQSKIEWAVSDGEGVAFHVTKRAVARRRAPPV